MSSSDEGFESLLKRARRGRPEPGSPAPYGLAQAVIVNWRSPRLTTAPLMALYLARWGTACALVISAAVFFTISPAPQATALMEFAGAFDEPSNSE